MLTSIRLVQSYGRGVVDLERFSGQTERSMHASLVAANIQARFSDATQTRVMQRVHDRTRHAERPSCEAACPYPRWAHHGAGV